MENIQFQGNCKKSKSYRPQLASWILKFMTVQFKQTKQVWLTWKEESLLTIKRPWQHGFQSTAQVLHLNKPPNFWNSLLWTDKRVEVFDAQCCIRGKPKTAYQHKYITSPVKHGGGGGDDLGLFSSHRTWAPWSH